MKDKKIRFKTFSFYDYTGIQEHLEKMASLGWMLEKYTPFYRIYRRIEPEKIHFSVVYFPAASELDPAPSENQHVFYDFCAQEGWKLAATMAQMQIFYNEQESPCPIETDASLQVKNIHTAAQKNFLFSHFVSLGTAFLWFCSYLLFLFIDPVESLFNNFRFFLNFSWLCLGILHSLELIDYFRWHKKARKAAESDGSFIPTKTRRKRIWIGISIAILFSLLSFSSFGIPYITIPVFLLFGIAIAAIIILIVELQDSFKRKKVPKEANVVLTTIISVILALIICGILSAFWLISLSLETKPAKSFYYKDHIYELYEDSLPLYLEDFSTVDYEGYSCHLETDNGIFLKRYRGSQQLFVKVQNAPSLEYEILTFHLPFFYDLCLKELAEQHEQEGTFVEIDTSLWGSDVKQVYQLYSDDEPVPVYLICWPDRIVDLDYSFELEDAQKQIIAEKLSEL